MNNEIKESLVDAFFAAALRQYAVDEANGFPSDDELTEKFPLEAKHKRLKRKYSKREKRRRAQAGPVVYLKRAAVIALSVIAVTFALLMTDVDVRGEVKKAVAEFFDKYVKINFSYSDEPEDDENSDVYSFEIGYIPEGFELAESDELKTSRDYIYFNMSGDYISVSIDSTGSVENNADIEEREIEEIEIGKFKGYIIYSAETKDSIIVIGNKTITISITGTIEKNDLIKIAENVKSASHNS